MTKFEMRITIEGLEEESVTKIKEFISTMSTYLVCEEGPDDKDKKLHWHVIGSCSAKNVKSLRTTFSRALPFLKGNECYHLGEWDGAEDLIRYVCKGTKDKEPTVIMSCGMEFLPERVREQHAAFYAKRTEWKSKFYEKKGAWFPKAMKEILEQELTFEDVEGFRKILSIVTSHAPCCQMNYIEAQLWKIRRELNKSEYDKTVYNSLVEKFRY